MASLLLRSTPVAGSRPVALRNRQPVRLAPVAAGKGELVDAIAAKHDKVTKADVKRIVEDVIEYIESNVEKGEKVTLVGFGTFELRDRAERNGRNPQTGESIKIPAKKAPGFTAAAAFKDRVNKGTPAAQPKK